MRLLINMRDTVSVGVNVCMGLQSCDGRLSLTVVMSKHQQGPFFQSLCNFFIWPTVLSRSMSNKHQSPERRWEGKCWFFFSTTDLCVTSFIPFQSLACGDKLKFVFCMGVASFLDLLIIRLCNDKFMTWNNLRISPWQAAWMSRGGPKRTCRMMEENHEQQQKKTSWEWSRLCVQR